MRNCSCSNKLELSLSYLQGGLSLFFTSSYRLLFLLSKLFFSFFFICYLVPTLFQLQFHPPSSSTCSFYVFFGLSINYINENLVSLDILFFLQNSNCIFHISDIVRCVLFYFLFSCEILV